MATKVTWKQAMVDKLYLTPQEQFYNAIEDGNVKGVAKLLRNPKVDPLRNDSFALWFAIQCAQVKVIELLVLDDRVDPGANHNQLIKWASQKGHVQLVSMIRHHQNVDPAAQDNYAIKQASAEGHVNVVRVLLKTRANPAAENNIAIIRAAANGRLHVVNLLLEDVRVNPADQDNLALELAFRRRKHYIVGKLLQTWQVLQSMSASEVQRFELLADNKPSFAVLVGDALIKNWCLKESQTQTQCLSLNGLAYNMKLQQLISEGKMDEAVSKVDYMCTIGSLTDKVAS